MIKLNKVKINKELAEKKIKNARARAARANKKFESASPAQKRIIIARDVISCNKLTQLKGLLKEDKYLCLLQKLKFM